MCNRHFSQSQVEFLGSKVVELERRHRSVSPPPSPRRSSTPRPFSPPLVLTTHSSTASFGTISGAASVGAIHAHPAPSLYSVVRDSGASFQTEEMQSQLKQKVNTIIFPFLLLPPLSTSLYLFLPLSTTSFTSFISQFPFRTARFVNCRRTS